jgi:hypothetical protein
VKKWLQTKAKVRIRRWRSPSGGAINSAGGYKSFTPTVVETNKLPLKKSVEQANKLVCGLRS